MSLVSLLSAEQIIPEMKATDRWPAIVELIDLLVSLGKIKPEDRDSILASLKQREETMSTGIGFGIAIPHASSDRVNDVVASFGRSSQGIEFDALDNAPVKFVVLFIVPKNQFQTHLRTLASIAKFLNDRSVRERLAEAKSADAILSVFRDRSQSFNPGRRGLVLRPTGEAATIGGNGDFSVTPGKEICRCAGEGGPSECGRADAGDRSALRRLSDQCRSGPRKRAQRKPENSGVENSRPT